MDKLLFTPGPLTTSRTVKEKMLRDLGSRDTEFMTVTEEVRNGILKVAGKNKNEGWESVLIQGSGTFAVESVLSSVISESDKLLIISNGAYGKRMAKISRIHKINHFEMSFPENQIPDIEKIISILESSNDFTHLAVVHCETTTGILNPIAEIGNLARSYGLVYIIDAMSSFGAIPIDLNECSVNYLISSSNKCIEGVPGFAFVIAKKENLLNSKGKARTLSLDLFNQWDEMERSGQFRFTPPVQIILAFRQALDELEKEGGVEARAARYKSNHKILIEGMTDMGFKPYIDPDHQSYIITSFLYPENKNFNFNKMYNFLNERNFVIYPGKLSETDTFRIGSIGRLNNQNMSDLMIAIKAYLDSISE